MKKGFTLVELSIVLVIIGLLIGGILVAQSLIDSSKIQAQIRQFQQFDIAVSNFQNNYNSLPGDSTKFTPIGNNNGRVADASGDYIIFDGEIANFWNHLSDAGLKSAQGSYTATVTGEIRPDVNTPKLEIGIERALVFATYVNTLPVNYYFIALQSSADGGTHLDDLNADGGAIKASDALAIDSKIDDGAALTGNVQTGFGAVAADVVDQSGGDGNCVNSSSPYNYLVSNSTEQCQVAIKLLSQTGQE